MTVPQHSEIARDHPVIEVFNPYDNSLVGTAEKANAETARAAIDRAVSYDHRLSPWQRYEMLNRACELLMERKDEFVRLISLESGKTLADSEIEVKRSYQSFLISGEEAKRINGEIIPVDAVADMPAARAMIVKEPVGVVVAITPFNYPLNLVAHKVGPALASNNAVIVKPSSATPLTALKMEELFRDAGVPPEMLQVVVGSSSEIGDILVTSPLVNKVTFTGSMQVGTAMCERIGMKDVSMELGGNDPMVILADADLDRAIPVAVDGAFGNNGERCTSVKRIIIEESIADEFAERFAAASRDLVVGDQMDPNTYIGPLINEAAAMEVEARINAAVADGAKLLCGGRREGALYWPTVIDHVSRHAELVASETFGPVAPIIRVADFDEAIEVANGTAYGLQSSVFTNDLDKAMEAASRIEAGAVVINRGPGFRAEHLPFGGVKQSGIGREGIKYAIDAMSRLKLIVI